MTDEQLGLLAFLKLLKKQDKLKSGQNIKTINNQSILGSGNIDVSGGGGSSNYNDLYNKPRINSVELSGNVSLDNLGVQPEGEYADTAITDNEIDNLINN